MNVGNMSKSEHDVSHSDTKRNRQAAEDAMSPPELRTWRATLVTRVVHVWFALTRNMTLGVRAAAFDDQGRVFLVRHSYVPGWHMPGGGVERGETAAQALVKELREEGNLELAAEPELISLYFNRRTSRRDHVAFYRCQVRQTAAKAPDSEILEAGFFTLDGLPQGVTAATLRRLAELTGKTPISDVW
jgi:ADP-ribose pyrophosphatase YjhB (NUDIX family)